MACRGVHFSLDELTVMALKAILDDQERLQFIQERIEEEYFKAHREWLAETDKAWDYIHRVLTDGELDWKNVSYPLNHVVMCGESLYSGSDYIISLKTPKQVADAVPELRKMTEASFREKFFRIDEFEIEHSYEEDFEYTWQWFQSLRDFWLRAASEGRYVLFTVDQ
jgi:hypothetical protein